MPARVPVETRRRYVALRAAGHSISDAAKAAGVSRGWAQDVEKARRKKEGALYYAERAEAAQPAPMDADKLGPEARRALSDFGFFRARYFGRRSVPWQEQAATRLVELLEAPEESFVVLNVPPGAGKSTLLTDTVMWVLCRDRATRVLYGSRTETQATMYTRRIRAALERTERVRASSGDIKRGLAMDAQGVLLSDFGKFKPANQDLWRSERFVVSQPGEVVADDKEASVAAFGMDSGVLGGRYDLNVWDDLVDGKTLRTSDAREKLVAFWESIAECQPGWAVVYMADGTHRRVDEIRAGDRVLSANGTTRVVAVGDNGMQDVYRVTTRAGREIFVTGNHPLLTPSGWIEAKGSLGHGVKSVGAQRGVDEVTEDEARLLGYMAGDGCLTRTASSMRCNFTNGDLGVIEDFLRIIAAKGWGYRVSSRGPGCVTLNLSGTGCLDFFRANDMANKGAHQKRVPDCVKRSSRKIQMAFLAGVFDTDGSLDQAKDNHNAAFRIRMSSEDMIRDLQDMLARIGVGAGITREKRKAKYLPIFGLRVQLSAAEPLLRYMRSEHSLKEPRLAEYRERLRATTWDTSFVADRVVSVEQISTEQTWGIETEDHTYVTGGIVTHNTRVEPAGLVALVGQRLDADDLYRYALDLRGGDPDEVLDFGGEGQVADDGSTGDFPRKYTHIKFAAHDDGRCEGRHDNPQHALDAAPWDGTPEGGCLLDPKRLSWRKLQPLKLHRAERFEVVYQQKDIDPASSLVKRDWIEGGQSADGEFLPGCKDADRRAWEIPRGLVGTKFGYITADPSPSKYWGIEAWVYHPSSNQRFLIDVYRAAMAAPDFLEFNSYTQSYTGLLEEWNGAFDAMGVPLTHVFVEQNAAQRFLLQYQFVQDWKAKRGVRIIGHDTHRNKSHPEYGVQMLAPLYMHGLVRLPWLGQEGRLASLKLIDEVTRWPHGGTDDLAMSQWFGEYNLPRFFREETNVVSLRPMDDMARRAQRVMPGLRTVG